LPKEELLQKARPGFSLFELIVVIFIIGLLAAMAIPSLKEVLPTSRLNAESRRLSAFLRQARLKSANTQKAVRVSINCMNHVYNFSRPCRAIMETAVYEGGIFDSWEQIRDGRLDFNNVVNIKAANNAWSPINGSLINSDLIWLIFTPSTRVMTSFGPPVNITMWYGDVPFGGRTYDLTLNQASGRVTVAQASH
jgi:prepilin-type N-terminal cleavage/methylation domain-containing protein